MQTHFLLCLGFLWDYSLGIDLGVWLDEELVNEKKISGRSFPSRVGAGRVMLSICRLYGAMIQIQLNKAKHILRKRIKKTSGGLSYLKESLKQTSQRASLSGTAFWITVIPSAQFRGSLRLSSSWWHSSHSHRRSAISWDQKRFLSLHSDFLIRGQKWFRIWSGFSNQIFFQAKLPPKDTKINMSIRRGIWGGEIWTKSYN